MAEFYALLVDDETEKRRLVAEALLDAGIDADHVISVADVMAAKRELSVRRFDLVILDVNLPKRPDQGPLPDGGIDVLRWLRRQDKSRTPTLVVALTAYSQSLELVRSEFNNLLVRIVTFTYDGSEWRNSIVLAVKDLFTQMLPPFATDGRTYNSSLGIVVGLENVELTAVRLLPLPWEQVALAADDARYFACSDGRHRFAIVACAAPAMGMPAAAVAAGKLISSFQPRLVCMPGICAGVRGRVAIGDIIVADPSWDWGDGKIVDGQSGDYARKVAPYQIRLSEQIRICVTALAEDVSFLKRIYEGFPGKKPDAAPRLLIGPLATGAAVMSNEREFSRVAEQHRKLLGLDMEIFGVAVACAHSATPKPLFLPIKSVCDFGDGAKNDEFQEYCAYVSSATMLELHRRLFPISSDDL